MTHRIRQNSFLTYLYVEKLFRLPAPAFKIRLSNHFVITFQTSVRQDEGAFLNHAVRTRCVRPLKKFSEFFKEFLSFLLVTQILFTARKKKN